MILSSLQLTNFRNFKKRVITFSQTVTAIVGDNTTGKTSIIEAIFYLATGKSFRAEKDGEVIAWGENIARIVGDISSLSDLGDLRRGDKEKLEIIFTERKQFMVNGVGKRMVDFGGILKAVLFRPEDLDLIIGSPSHRRRYLDFVLMQVDREYRRAIISYEKGIRQRNRLLERIRDGEASRSQLLFWDQLLIKNGNYISDKRQEFIEYVNRQKKQLGDFLVVYDDSQISTGRLEQYAEAEVASGVTLVGPHRDDIRINLKSQNSLTLRSGQANLKSADRDLAIYGSRGEQRLAVLWLKLCELLYVEEASGEKPILLLDDIFSELDHSHRDLVFKIMDKQQTIVTSADPHTIKDGVKMEIIKL